MYLHWLGCWFPVLLQLLWVYSLYIWDFLLSKRNFHFLLMHLAPHHHFSLIASLSVAAFCLKSSGNHEQHIRSVPIGGKMWELNFWNKKAEIVVCHGVAHTALGRFMMELNITLLSIKREGFELRGLLNTFLERRVK